MTLAELSLRRPVTAVMFFVSMLSPIPFPISSALALANSRHSVFVVAVTENRFVAPSGVLAETLNFHLSKSSRYCQLPSPCPLLFSLP